MLPAVKTWMNAHRIRILLGGAVAVAVAATVTALVLTSSDSGSGSDRNLPPTRARVYTEQQACLLTGERGLADPAAAPVWAGMRDASADTHAKITYLAMAGEQSPAAAGPYLATLAGRKCAVVLTVGAAPDGAVPAAGPKYPGTRFVAVGGKSGKSGGANVTAVPEGSTASTRAAVKAAVTDALRH
jgi:hypothetical protein